MSVGGNHFGTFLENQYPWAVLFCEGLCPDYGKNFENCDRQRENGASFFLGPRM